MEPNVDRGMWSVVALLAAIVIGGVVLLAFPKITGKITNNMNSTVNEAFEGGVPSWVSDSENGILSGIKFDKVNLLTEKKLLATKVIDSNQIGYIKKAPKQSMRSDYTRNYLDNSNNIFFNSNNNDLYPIKVSRLEGYTRIERTPSNDAHVLNLYNDIRISQLDDDFHKEISDYETILVSFEVRASEPVDMSLLSCRKLKDPAVGGDKCFPDHKKVMSVGKEWSTISVEMDPEDVPWSQTEIIRLSPFLIKQEDIMDLTLDIKNYRVGKEKGKWYPSFNDTKKEDMTAYYIYFGGKTKDKLKMYSHIKSSDSETEKHAYTQMEARSVGSTNPQITMHGKNFLGSTTISSKQAYTYKNLSKFYKNRALQFRVESEPNEKVDIRMFVSDPKTYMGLE